MKNENDFNTFTGFKYDNSENPEKSTRDIHELLNHLFVKDEYKKYMLEWLSFIIKKKDKTDVCITLYSHQHGVGKNSFIELIRKLIDEKYLSKLENIDELHSQFNSFCESKFIIYGDEILAKTKDLYLTLKNTITRSQVKINKKGIDAYDVENYVNYIFSTNERVPFKIERNDRRMTMMHVSEEKLSKEQINRFYKAINDEDIIKSFYHELLNYDTPEKIECLDTPLKREIQRAYLLSPIKYLFKNYRNLEGRKYSVIELFEKIKDFEKSQGYTDLKTTQQMSMILSDIGDFTYKSGSKRGYRFIDLERQLRMYDEEQLKDYEKDYEDE